MKTIGIIGGLGPQTTADFYMRLHQLVDVRTTGYRPSILIYNVPITTFLEEENIIHERRFKPVLPYLIDAATRLERAGADFIVLACNSLHIFEKEIAESVKVPFISIVETTADAIKRAGYKKVGLLGTYKTNSSGMYDKELRENNIDLVKLDREDQQSLSALIIRLLNSRYNAQDQRFFETLMEKFIGQGAQKVILACTDFHLLLDQDKSYPMLDSMEVLAQKSASLLSEV